ncbi:reverse transcriptase-like protein [Candidatus Saccharibacteria bacterium]|nr:reverse transcriptase-like protein [Candidatus Saccharibacteria bacterium]
MKQRVRVVGILKEEGEVLLMKRRTGRSSEPVFWELPTGKIKFGEQPEEAMSRTALEYLGAEVKEVKLRDVVTFLAFEGASQMANLYIVYELGVKPGTKIRPNERYSAFKFLKKDEFSKVRVDEATSAVLELESEKSDNFAAGAGNYRETVNGATVYVDGSSRGNPGPAGVGYRIVGENGEELARGGEFVGFATSRVAEYYALRTGVEKAVEMGLKRVKFIGDNLMMMNQMNGIYKIKNRDLLPIYADIRKMVAENFEAVSFVHVKRELNGEADREANLAIDRHFDADVIK